MRVSHTGRVRVEALAPNQVPAARSAVMVATVSMRCADVDDGVFIY